MRRLCWLLVFLSAGHLYGAHVQFKTTVGEKRIERSRVCFQRAGEGDLLARYLTAGAVVCSGADDPIAHGTCSR